MCVFVFSASNCCLFFPSCLHCLRLTFLLALSANWERHFTMGKQLNVSHWTVFIYIWAAHSVCPVNHQCRHTLGVCKLLPSFCVLVSVVALLEFILANNINWVDLLGWKSWPNCFLPWASFQILLDLSFLNCIVRMDLPIGFVKIRLVNTLKCWGYFLTQSTKKVLILFLK